MKGSASVSLVSICAIFSALAATLDIAAEMPTKCLDFAAYPASKEFKGPRASVKVGKGSPGHKYRTLIGLKAIDAPDFAGHLQIVEFGCGSNCHLFLIVDKKTGDVWLPKAEKFGAALGYGFDVSSRLFVIDPPEDIEGEPEGGPLRDTVKSISYVWDESHHVLRSLPGCDGYQSEAGTK